MEHLTNLTISFFDLEIDSNDNIVDIGLINTDDTQLHGKDVHQLIAKLDDADFICGHNIFAHDLVYLKQQNFNKPNHKIIDTLYLSALLFPQKPYHSLNKDYKTAFEASNSPLMDAVITKDLFFSLLDAFYQLPQKLQTLFYLLLKDSTYFQGFFKLPLNIDFDNQATDVLIDELFIGKICLQGDIKNLIEQHPVELAYCLTLIFAQDRHSITPKWLLHRYPAIETIINQLRATPCGLICAYCQDHLDAKFGLKKYFGYDNYRSYHGKNLQEQAVTSALEGDSLLAVFPTGGGKSITFQVPALMMGEASKSLTVVISPLQSLMKDQVDNLESKSITDAVTINGLLDIIECSKAIERVENGSASILYISPEKLRSKTIERLLLSRHIARFVIDEAHCFSAWGQDFRVDYLYIGDFIKDISTKKQLSQPIPVSCFTATAKQKVIEDICHYFKEKLNLDLLEFSTTISRENLSYQTLDTPESQKYQTLRELILQKDCPTIIYVSRTKYTHELATKLTQDGIVAKPYNGKMPIADKIANQESFIQGDTKVMVATSAFGMGVDKQDVGLVIHYHISDSLENYIQEVGRAGRDAKLQAECLILFEENDLNKHFTLLNQTKLSVKEINQVWRAIKKMTQQRSSIANSALEIAKEAGWDDSINANELETRIKTAILALEDAGYIKRGQNMPRVFATSILPKNAKEAIDIIHQSTTMNDRQKEHAIRIIKKLFSAKSQRLSTDETGESRVDYISDHLGIDRHEVIATIERLKQIKILADTHDLTGFIKKSQHHNKANNVLAEYIAIEKGLMTLIDDNKPKIHLKKLNNQLQNDLYINHSSIKKIKDILNFWSIKNFIKKQYDAYDKNQIYLQYKLSKTTITNQIQERHLIASLILACLYELLKTHYQNHSQQEELFIEFSILQLQQYCQQHYLNQVFDLKQIEDALFYLSKIGILKIEGGFLVIYNRLQISRLEQNNAKQYTKNDYKKMDTYYKGKVQQIHIVGEYAKKMLSNHLEALEFAEDYFLMNHHSFLRKYFQSNEKRAMLEHNMTPKRYQELFGELSDKQLQIIQDNNNPYIVVLAGPGSGKTKVLVHKLASLLLMEDVKHEQLLMLTFSRAAAIEFKSRLYQLIGNAARYVQIQTFHGYCFDLLGKVGTLEQSEQVIYLAIQKIKDGEIESSRITKTVLVIDEAQDMSQAEFALIQTLMGHNDDLRVIAVGDDDQNIYEFRGSSSVYLQQLISTYHAQTYELIDNYRSRHNIVDFANQFLCCMQQRLKTSPIQSHDKTLGNIHLYRYQSPNMITPMIQSIAQSPMVGSVAVLTQTNVDAEQITGLLKSQGLPAKLIQSKDGFNIIDLAEIRAFCQAIGLFCDNHAYFIDNDVWQTATTNINQYFTRSKNLDIINRLIKIFEQDYPDKKYFSDFRLFLSEINLEDLYQTTHQEIIISTLHKAKGREFDHVFLLLKHPKLHKEEEKRSIYVAITRAKQHLSIFTNSSIFDHISTDNLTTLYDNQFYRNENQMVLYATHKDVNLGKFSQYQQAIGHIQAGDELIVNQQFCYHDRQTVANFSRAFQQKIHHLLAQGYQLQGAKVNFVVFWYDKNTGQEYQIILPEIYLSKQMPLGYPNGNDAFI